MLTMAERIRKIRKELPGKVTQKAFGEQLGVSMAVITSYELGKATPPPATRKLICSTFRVNEQWLETGTGDPYDVQAPDLSQEIREIMRGEDSLKVAVMASLAQMPQEWWDSWRERLEQEIKKAGRS